MGVPFERLVAQDINRGYGTVDVTMPAGGTALGDKIGIHTFLSGVYNVLDLGCQGDGSADETATLALALTIAANGTLVFPPGTYSVGTMTIPATVTLQIEKGAVISVRPGATLTVNGTVVAHGAAFTGAGTTTFPTTTAPLILNGQIAIGTSAVDAQRRIVLGGAWTGALDATYLGLTATLTPAIGGDANGFKLTPVLRPAASGTNGILTPLQIQATFAQNGTGLVRTIFTGAYFRTANIPLLVLQPFDGTYGTAYGMYAETPTINGAVTTQTYAAGFNGAVGLLGVTQIQWEPTATVVKGLMARSTGNDAYIVGSLEHDFCHRMDTHAFLWSEDNGGTDRMKISSGGVWTLKNKTAVTPLVYVIADPSAFNNVGAVAFGTAVSTATPFLIDQTSFIGATNADVARARMQNTNALLVGGTGTSDIVATLDLSEPNINLNGGAAHNAFTLVVRDAPTEGNLRNGAIWVKAGSAVFDGRVLGSRGANVVAANNLTVGTDGNVFTVTGNTQINALTSAGWQSGSVIRFQFTGTPTVKHNTAGGAGTLSFDLQGGVDLVASATTVLTVVLIGAYFVEVGRRT